MADDDDDSQKTEDPTPRRLEEARKKGQVAVSRELNNWIMLMAGTLIIALAAGPVMANLADYMKGFIEHPHLMPQVPGGFSIVLGQTFWHVVGVLMVPILALIIAAIAGPFAQVGPLFAPEVLHPDISKLSPMKGIERLFSRRSLMEFVKGLFKIVLIGFVCYLAIQPYFQGIDHFVGMAVPDMLAELMQLFVRMMIAVLVALAVLAVIDVLYQRHEHLKKMRMTRQELRDEYKQSEGDPHIKAKLRQLRNEKARQRMMQNVPKADVVITNPTHFAVALQYNPEEMDAPKCVAKGANDIALKIREVAKENKVAIVENPPLARLLYSSVEIDETVPPEHYKAVAEVISYVFKLKGKIR
jgi:flagellar biosynthetic protein FlhB